VVKKQRLKFLEVKSKMPSRSVERQI